MTSFKQGMTITQRRRLREEILARHLEKAREEAARARLTLTCRNAMYYTSRDPAEAVRFHARCKAEERGGTGCLCLCHDTIEDGSLEAGQMTEIT